MKKKKNNRVNPQIFKNSMERKKFSSEFHQLSIIFCIYNRWGLLKKFCYRRINDEGH